jgi:hypothetical protein
LAECCFARDAALPSAGRASAASHGKRKAGLTTTHEHLDRATRFAVYRESAIRPATVSCGRTPRSPKIRDKQAAQRLACASAWKPQLLPAGAEVARPMQRGIAAGAASRSWIRSTLLGEPGGGGRRRSPRTPGGPAVTPHRPTVDVRPLATRGERARRRREERSHEGDPRLVREGRPRVADPWPSPAPAPFHRVDQPPQDRAKPRPERLKREIHNYLH